MGTMGKPQTPSASSYGLITLGVIRDNEKKKGDPNAATAATSAGSPDRPGEVKVQDIIMEIAENKRKKKKSKKLNWIYDGF